MNEPRLCDEKPRVGTTSRYMGVCMLDSKDRSKREDIGDACGRLPGVCWWLEASGESTLTSPCPLSLEYLTESKDTNAGEAEVVCIQGI